eukprot:12910757-Prorocentrum_lima.AAC.1
MQRALLHSMRLLLPGISKEETVLAGKVSKLNQLLRQNPNSLTGRQVYLKELVGLAKRRRWGGAGWRPRSSG